jgi:hypothetical protein
MNKIKHNKLKNTGIIFEILTRNIVSESLKGKESKAINIIKKHFSKSELGKEYKIYENITKRKGLNESKANILLEYSINDYDNLNKELLKKQKYNLIKEISEHYNVNDFFKVKINNYKLYASIYLLLEYNKITSSNNNINIKFQLLEQITNNKEESPQKQLVEIENEDKDIRILTYKILLEKFNEKYNFLNDPQKNILREFIYNTDNSLKLKEFYNNEIDNIKNKLNSLNKLTKDKSVKIKINEIQNILNPLEKNDKIKDKYLEKLLTFHELIEELKIANNE